VSAGCVDDEFSLLPTGELIIVDILAKWRRDAFERHVIDCFQNAGVVDPDTGTRLAYLDKDKCEFALMWLEICHGIVLDRDYRTLAELAKALDEAIRLR